MQIINSSWQIKFATIWAGQSVSLLTSSILQMAIVWHLTYTMGSASVLALATLLGYLPAAILSIFIGPCIDKYNKKFIIMLSDLFIGLLGVILIIVGNTGAIPTWLIMCVLTFRSIGNAFHYPALQSITPTIVPAKQITKYAGYSQCFESISMVLSPALAALIYSMFGLNFIIMLDVIGVLVAILLLFPVEIPKIITLNSYKPLQLFKDVLNGFEALKRVKGMSQLMLVGALYATIYFPIGTLYPFITIEYFKGNVVDSGVVEVVFAIGYLLGSFTLGIVGDKLNKLKTIAFSMCLYGLGVFATGLLPTNGFKVFTVLSFLMGFTVPFYTGIQTAIFQLSFSQEYLGRVFSISSGITLITMPVGLILAGVFAESIGIDRWFLFSGVFTVILAFTIPLIPALQNCCETKNIN